MAAYSCLAIDLGAGSGRAILGSYNNGKIETSEIHRFQNDPITVHGHLRWNTHVLLSEIRNSLKICNHQHRLVPESMGIDTWGVDFALLDSTGELLEQPFAYRDRLTETAMAEVFAKIPAKKLYELTGIQFMPFNSLFQFWAIKNRYQTLMARADSLLFMPDYLTYKLTGESYTEYTIASTSQMLDPETRKWKPDILMKLGLPTDLLQEIIFPGTQVGILTNSIAGELGIPQIPLIAVAAHDTASAIAAIPATEKNWAYISSGTWSLMGIETDQPVVNPKTYSMSFTNEGGVDGKIRLLKNITGLWLLNECKKVWDADGITGFDALIAMAEKARPFRSLIDPDHPSFMNPEDMCSAISAYCKNSQQPVPASKGEFTRTILESLALKYRFTLDQLREVSPHPIDKLHVIGGGSQNGLLCQFTANATQLPVVAGPAEGTAMGNLLVQVMAAGELSSLEEIRCTVKNSVKTTLYEPTEESSWSGAYLRFRDMLGKHPE